jgi:hypothetical protein
MDSASALPYGTLLCVSDKPLHGIIKLPGMADAFYRQRVDQHLELVYAQSICCARSLPSSSIAASYAVLPRFHSAETSTSPSRQKGTKFIVAIGCSPAVVITLAG